MNNNNQIQHKSEILFLYETSYNTPNGDPFTGEQRFDEETKKILVSDVRIKRFIRTYLEEEKNFPIYVSDKTNAGKTDAKGIIQHYLEHFFDNLEKETEVLDLLKRLIDVRLFGGVSTLGNSDTPKFKKKNGEKEIEKKLVNGHVNLTGAVQFAMLNPSLNSVNMRMHQNTSHFKSKEEKKQGAMATSSLVPYSLVQIHGWVNPKVAEKTGLTYHDLLNMFEGLWYGTNGYGTSHSRSKCGQDSLLILEIIYKESNQKIYGLNRKIKLHANQGIKQEQIRSWDDYSLDFCPLIEAVNSDKVTKVRYYTENEKLEKVFTEGVDESGNEEWFKKVEKIQFIPKQEEDKK